MARKLTNDDGRMVDMLLNGGGAAMENPPLTQVFSNPRPEMFEMRLESVEKVLSLLDLMPASDPPADLISRTMDRIEEANLTGDGLAARPSRASAPTQRPQA
jgi:hypothetical protein